MKIIKDFYHKLTNWISSQPKTFVRIVILSACFIAVVFQLTECVIKLVYPPITTHSHFDLNKTMYYPAITFCREPAYKLKVLESFNLSFHPSYEKYWDNFDFNVANLSTVFSEAPYNFSEFFIEDGISLEMKAQNVRVDETLHFGVGKCYTVIPLVGTGQALRESGYSIELSHTEWVSEYGDYDKPGWHVYIHEPHEKFSEEGMKKSGRVEYMYIEVNEEIHLKLNAEHFIQLRGYDNKCTEDHQFGHSICGEYCKWNMVTKKVGCTGPWMPLNIRMCDNVEDTKNLIEAYKKTIVEENSCGCQEPCKSVIYSAFVVNRKSYNQKDPRTVVFLHYSSKKVIFIEERFGYNFSQFISDIGGSLGFLLGLSVIGLIAIMEKLLGCVLKKGKCGENGDEDGNGDEENESKEKNKEYTSKLDSRY